MMSDKNARTRWLAWFALGVAGAVIPGCVGDGAGRREVTTALEQHILSNADTATAYALAKPIPAESETADAKDVALDAGASGDEPDSLRAFIVLALAENPSIKAAADRARAKAERIAQVTALPDPTVKTKTLPEPVRTAEGDNFFNLGVSQKFPVREKLDAKGRIALDNARIALEQLKKTRLKVIADVKRVYFALYVIDRSIEVTLANQDLLGGLIDVALAQVASGRRGQDDVLRAQVELSNLESELIALRQKRVTKSAKLNALLNRDPTLTIAPPTEFDIRTVDYVVDDLFQRAIAANPDLGLVEHRIHRDEQSVELAKLAYWPDFTIGFEWMQMDPRGAFKAPRNPNTGRRPVTPQLSEDGSDNWAITFGFNVPLWFGKIEAGIDEARHALSASRHDLVAARNGVHAQVEDALERVRSQHELATLFGNTIIPQAEQTYRVSQASYTAGKSDFLYVIDNWRKWLVFTIQYYRSIGELERSVADLEQAIGISLSEAGAP